MADAPDPEQRLAKFKKALGDKDPYVLVYFSLNTSYPLGTL